MAEDGFPKTLLSVKVVALGLNPDGSYKLDGMIDGNGVSSIDAARLLRFMADDVERNDPCDCEACNARRAAAGDN